MILYICIKCPFYNNLEAYFNKYMSVNVKMHQKKSIVNIPIMIICLMKCNKYIKECMKWENQCNETHDIMTVSLRGKTSSFQNINPLLYWIDIIMRSFGWLPKRETMRDIKTSWERHESVTSKCHHRDKWYIEHYLWLHSMKSNIGRFKHR